ncbi:MAG: nucleotidyl transferase AbiEii/AbiGii toxin family protein [Ilumatobacter sp.]|uniref:nucleotidyl transferase AbiEii/AbiGii toxin family protein n=1 Tax=Ilumatobacter sp. TaxID=1967498 RepID=UPI00391DAC1A
MPFELGHDEIGSTKQHDLRIAHDIVTMFESIGLPEPQPIPLLTVEHQIAQKLHACTSVHPRTGNNDRAHDLVDLQILELEEPIDKTAVAEIATRLFRARNAYTWPPVVISHPSWPTIYAEAADGLDVLTDIEDAVAWTNNFITSLTTD